MIKNITKQPLCQKINNKLHHIVNLNFKKKDKTTVSLVIQKENKKENNPIKTYC
jgi:hypothetical protein